MQCLTLKSILHLFQCLLVDLAVLFLVNACGIAICVNKLYNLTTNENKGKGCCLTLIHFGE